MFSLFGTSSTWAWHETKLQEIFIYELGLRFTYIATLQVGMTPYQSRYDDDTTEATEESRHVGEHRVCEPYACKSNLGAGDWLGWLSIGTPAHASQHIRTKLV